MSGMVDDIFWYRESNIIEDNLPSTIWLPPRFNQVCFWTRENRSCDILTLSSQVVTAKLWDGCRWVESNLRILMGPSILKGSPVHQWKLSKSMPPPQKQAQYHPQLRLHQIPPNSSTPADTLTRTGSRLHIVRLAPTIGPLIMLAMTPKNLLHILYALWCRWKYIYLARKGR